MVEDTETKAKTPWDMARETGKTIITPVMGPMIGVYYPYRKTGDLYVALKDQPVFCCQCKAEFPFSELPQHIDSHDRRRKKNKYIAEGPNEGA